MNIQECVLTIKQSDLSETTDKALRVLWDARWMRKRRKMDEEEEEDGKN